MSDLIYSLHVDKFHKPLQDLHDDSIRLISLRDGADDEPLVVELDEVHLRDSPVYLALSYTWTSPGSECRLYLRDHEKDVFLAVRPNVDFVLRRLRTNLGKNEQLRIWIDAVCIDQANLQEKSKQVSRMGKIYSQAKKVLVYLGEADERTKMGLQAINVLAKAGEIPHDDYVYDRLTSSAEDEESISIEEDEIHLASVEDDSSTGQPEWTDISEASFNESLEYACDGQEAESAARPQVQLFKRNLKRKRASYDSMADARNGRERSIWEDHEDIVSVTSDHKNPPQRSHYLQYLDLSADDGKISRLYDRFESSSPPESAEFAVQKLVRDLPAATQELIALDSEADLAFVMQCVLSIFDRPWYSRIWIQQEVILASTIGVMIGEFDITWEALVAADMTCFLEDLRLGPCFGLCAVLEAKRKMQKSSRETQAIDALLSHASYARQVKSSDPRDKIYGWLGLVPSEHTTIDPDYSISTADAYMKFTELMVLQYGDLAVLALCGPGGPSDLPSWVPDFDARGTTDGKGSDNFRTTYPSFYATGNSKVLAQKGLQKGLILRGVLFDEVSVTSVSFRQLRSRAQNPEFRRETIELIVDAWKSFAKKCCPDPYLSGESVHDAFWRTMVQHRNPADAKILQSSGDSVYQMLVYHLDNALPNLQDMSSDDLREYLLKDIGGSGPSSSVLAYVVLQLTGLRMFVTKAGYLGLGYYNLTKGDKLALFSGGKMPFLIRMSGQPFSLVSVCYLHGAMNGQFWGDHRHRMQDIALY